MAFADSDDMVAQYDEQTLKDLCSDDGTPSANLSADAKMAAALERASGVIISACHVARIYSTSDLNGLTGPSQAYLKSLTCELAMAYLIERRPEKFGEAGERRMKRVDEILTMFRRGERVFDVEANKTAGLPTISGPTAIEMNRQNLITSRAHGFYPNTAQRLPLGRG